MGPKIEFVKEQFQSMFDAVKETYGQVLIKAGVVAYRDFDQGENHTDVLDFTGNPAKLRDFLSSVKAVGGGDVAEDVFTGLEKAATLSWMKSCTNLICHVADAPCHGSAFHDLSARCDDRMSGDPKNRDIKKLLSTLFHTCRVTKYFFSHLNNSTVKMVKEFRKAAPEADWLKDDHVQNNQVLKEFICNSIISTVTVSLSTSGCARSDAKRPVSKNYPIDPKEPDWSSLSVLYGTNCEHEMLVLSALHGALADHRPLPIGKDFRMQLKIAPRPFSNEGVSRYPFYATWLDAPSGRDKSGQLVKQERKMVLKEFKYDQGYVAWVGKIDFTDVSAYLLQGEVQTVASVLAREFNQDIRGLRWPSAKEIRFPKVWVVSVRHPSGVKYYNMEQLLQAPGGATLDFVRFTNNNGAIGKEGLAHPYSDSVLAFSHYTYEKSNRCLMVTDLQGCWCQSPAGKKQFTLSDPMIHSDKYLLRSPGNFGKKGAAAFFKTHKCNDVCRALGLNPASNYVAPSDGGQGPGPSGASSSRLSSVISDKSCVTEFGSHM